MKVNKVEQIIRLTDFLPLRSYFSVFNIVWKETTPDQYVLDLHGVDEIDQNVIGLIVLLKQHANDSRSSFELKNHTHLLEKLDASPALYQRLFA
ncbi:MAG: hypothetical protein OEX19_09805 [Gammaproteobacteria bacterium]|nr:hypothetical protein [Gammaproteobacteria bacterium]